MSSSPINDADVFRREFNESIILNNYSLYRNFMRNIFIVCGLLPVSIFSVLLVSSCASSMKLLSLVKEVARFAKFPGSTGFDCSMIVHSASWTKLNSRNQNSIGPPWDTRWSCPTILK